MTIAPSITTRTSTLEIDQDGIIIATILPNVHGTLADATENMAAMEALSQGRPFLLLLDMREMQSQDRDARYAYTNAPTQPHALAIIVGSAISRITGNLFVTMKRPVFPSRLFTDMHSAMTWLEKHLSLIHPRAS
jgi:hypothetical protein